MIMSLQDKRYYAKILLFGEYTVIRNSMALSLPFRKYSGRLSFPDQLTLLERRLSVSSNEQLRKFYRHLVLLQESGSRELSFDLKALRNDIDRGLYFESSIPHSYGLGSSGALCAALYDNYGNLDDKRQSGILTSEQMPGLKNLFSQIESYFHGTSSGLDPLISFLSHPLLIRSKGVIEKAEIPLGKIKDKLTIFLLDTRKVGKTGPLVSYFLEKMKDDEFRAKVENDLTTEVNGCIESVLTGNTDRLFTHLAKLSMMQFDLFRPMIVPGFEDAWKEGLDSGAYTLKLCGSGGGGYLLGFTRDIDRVRTHLKKYGLEPSSVMDDLL